MKKITGLLISVVLLFAINSLATDFEQIFEKISDCFELDESKYKIEMPDIDNFYIDKNLDIYMADLFAGNVKRWNKDGKLLMVYGNRGNGPGELQKPFIAIAKKGFVIVTDLYSMQATLYNKANGKYATQKKLPSGCHMLNLDRSDKILCGDLLIKGQDKIYILDDNMDIKKKFFNPKMIIDAERSLCPFFPMDFDSSGNAYISSYLTYKFAKYDKNQNLIGVFGSPSDKYIIPQDTSKMFLDKNAMKDYMQSFTYLRRIFILKDKYVLLIFTTPGKYDEWFFDIYETNGKKLISGMSSKIFFIGKNKDDELYTRTIEDRGDDTVYKIYRYRLRNKIEW